MQDVNVSMQSIQNFLVPYAREKTILLNKPPLQKWISEIDSLFCPIHTLVEFLDALAQEKHI